MRDDESSDGIDQDLTPGNRCEPADPLSRVADAVVDGEPVDWSQVESAAASDDDPMLRAWRDVESVIQAHRDVQTADAAEADPSQPAAPAARPTARPRRRPAPLGPGDRWSHLEIERHLVGGGFGDVYAAIDTTIERRVALKLMRPVEEADEASEAYEAQLDEARLLARVQHDNVVTVYGADRVDGHVGIWMELLQGHTLTDEIDRYGPMGADEASVIGMKLCDALAAVHRRSVVHRDVKAQNVMREPGGRIVLTDFGIGFDESRKRGAGPAGTPVYLAPELLAGGEATVQSDLYALGVLLFHLVTGSFPVRARSLAEFRQRHQEGEATPLPDLRSDLPEVFVQVVEKALAHDPKRRFRSAGAFHRALSKAMASTVLRDAWSGTARRSRRRQFLRGASVAAVVLTLLGVVLWQSLAPEPPEPDPIRVLLGDVDDRSGDLAFTGSFDGALRAAVRDSGAFEPVSREKERQVARLMLLPDRQASMDDRQLREAAVRLRVPAVLNGELLTTEDGWELGLWLTSTLDEGVRRTERRPMPKLTMAALEVALDGALDDLEVSAREWLADGGPLDATELPELEPVTTHSLAALRRLTEGLEAYRAGDIETTEANLRSALELDSGFASAYLHLGHCLAAEGDPAGSLEMFRRAFELVSRTGTDLERLNIEGAYYAAVRQYRRAIDKYRQILDLVGENPSIRRQLSLAHMELGQLEEAVLNARLGRGESLNHGLLVYMLAVAGQPDLALEEARGIREAFGETEYLLWSEALVLVGLDRLDEAIDKVRAMQESTSRVYRNLASWMEARILIYRGDLTQAAQVLFRDRRTDIVEGTGFLEIRRRYWTARIQMIRGQHSNALSGLDTLDEPDIPAHLNGWRSVAVIRAELGDVDGARRILRRLEQVHDEHPSLISDMVTAQVEAEIELASGRPKAALDLLAQSGAQNDVSFLRTWARAHAAAGDLEQAVFYDLQLIERRGELLDREFAGLWVEAHVRRARCLKLLGRGDEAAGHWRVAQEWWGELARRAYGVGAPADALPGIGSDV